MATPSKVPQSDGVKGNKTLHPLLATACTPLARPVVVAIRMRQGRAADVRGAARFLAEALTTVRAIASQARIVVRADSKFSTADVVATAARLRRGCVADYRLQSLGERRHHPDPADRVDGDPLPERVR